MALVTIYKAEQREAAMRFYVRIMKLSPALFWEVSHILGYVGFEKLWGNHSYVYVKLPVMEIEDKIVDRDIVLFTYDSPELHKLVEQEIEHILFSFQKTRLFSEA